MKNEQIEQLLRRYQPLSPSASLRSRVLNEAAVPRRVPIERLDWSLAAAAVLLVALAFATKGPQPRQPAVPKDALRDQRIQMVARLIGDGPHAAQIATLMIASADSPVKQKEEVPWH
jgi:hypothetical protein